LIKSQGIKNKNIKKQKNIEDLAKGMLEAEGRENEGEVIDMNKLANLDEYGNINFDEQMDKMAEMNIDENPTKKSKKRKEKGMEIDLDITVKNRKDLNYRQRRNKKKKSNYIINY
jgi:hypothetical protein